jgi:hypothetical protein
LGIFLPKSAWKTCFQWCMGEFAPQPPLLATATILAWGRGISKKYMFMQMAILPSACLAPWTNKLAFLRFNPHFWTTKLQIIIWGRCCLSSVEISLMASSNLDRVLHSLLCLSLVEYLERFLATARRSSQLLPILFSIHYEYCLCFCAITN